MLNLKGKKETGCYERGKTNWTKFMERDRMETNEIT